jgi:hypothetical protein
LPALRKHWLKDAVRSLRGKRRASGAGPAEADWLVISNCQTLGLRNSLTILNPTRQIAHWNEIQFAQNMKKIVASFDLYEKIFVGDGLLAEHPAPFAGRDNVVPAPILDFHAFHPDACYVTVDGKILKSPVVDYHSLVCLAAFQRGLNETQALALFRRETYEAAGYFDLWPSERRRVVERCGAIGYDLRDSLRQWGLRDAFMHSLNHPKIHCLFDIARMATIKAGFAPADCPFLPHDNLANGATFGLYPEIAEEYGYSGGYWFKPGGEYRPIDLKQFIAGSFAIYRAIDPNKLKTWGDSDRRRAAIAATI